MDILNESISFIANGISYNISQMRKVIEDNSTYNNLDIKEVIPEIKFESANKSENQDKLIEEVKKRLPIAVFNSKDMMITINNNENQLIVAGANQTKDSDIICTIFENLLKANVANFSQLNSIILTYTRNVNAKDEKLKLLNEEIEKIDKWEKNKTFILTIPFDYDEFILTIKVQKLINRQENDKDRLYQFVANFNYNLGKVEFKQEKLKNILHNYSDHFYSKIFIEKYNEFMELKYEKRRSE